MNVQGNATGEFSIVALDKFIQATRDSGYKGTSSAVAELVDNSLQAGATIIAVQLTVDGDDEHPIVLTLSDNGTGMDSRTLRTALRFGGSTRFNNRNGLGRYGMGLPNSSLSQAKRVTVHTWGSKKGRVLRSYLDIDEIVRGDLIEVPKPTRVCRPGPVLDGTLRNTTATSIHIGVQLRRGLYLANRRASAQNMLATAVYERGGSYYLEDDEPFIEVLPHEVKEVTFKAYCLDFDLENPAATDSLAVQLVPPDLSEIIDNLLEYEQTAGDQEESTVRAQIAIWLAQGHAPEEIRERFSFTAADLDEAHRIIAGTF